MWCWWGIHSLSVCLSISLSLGREVECELPLLVEVGAAHLHCQPPITCAAAVQAQVAAHVPQLGVALNLLPFLETHEVRSGKGWEREETKVYKSVTCFYVMWVLLTKNPIILWSLMVSIDSEFMVQIQRDHPNPEKHHNPLNECSNSILTAGLLSVSHLLLVLSDRSDPWCMTQCSARSPVCCRFPCSPAFWFVSQQCDPPPSDTGPCASLTCPWSAPIPEEKERETVSLGTPQWLCRSICKVCVFVKCEYAVFACCLL